MKKFVAFLVIIIAFASCSPYEKVKKSNDINYKLTKANEYYDAKSYMKANELYQSLIPVLKGTKNFETVLYRYAYSFYYQKEYLAASYHFKNFAEGFPTSKYAVECEYMYALCLMKQSPKPSLDQTNTIKAAEAMQNFLSMYAQSDKAKEANEYIDQARKKLEEKDAQAAKLYYNIGQYKAAGVAYKMLTESYPESNLGDFYHLMIIKSTYNYAKLSLKEKQEERFSNTIDAVKDFKAAYPSSKYLHDVDKHLTQSENYIKKLRNEHN